MRRLTMKTCKAFALGVLLTSALALPASQAAPAPQEKQGNISAEQQTRDKASEKRKEVIEEAVTAVQKTREALRHLEAGENDKALDALSLAIGKLETVIALNPELALAPVDVKVITLDLIADVDAVRKAVKEVKDLIEDDRIQEARLLLKDLASEVIVRVINIPLATYPDAIKEVVPLIDQGKIKEAKAALEVALSSLVVVDHISPLPVLRAEAMLDEAAKLADKKDRSKEENQKLEKLLTDAGSQLDLAEALGYGTREDYKPLHELLEEIKEKTSGGKSGQGKLFHDLKERLEKHLEGFWNRK
ncbi:MAG: hypothetical protein D6786_00300 [Gammaproteobacteria bacterium]|nr:MAG: hypothetical protein D6786_00300 [Gammaproteobacteria bacterium]